MASSDPELKDGFPIPNWMKTKPTREFEPFAASPPAPEDSFFYIRYPKTDILMGQKIEQNSSLMESKEVASATYGVRQRDWTKHTEPCQEVMHGIASINTAANPAAKPNSAGSDDGFKGKGSDAGSSVVKAASHMIPSSRSSRGFQVASPMDDASPPDGQSQYNLMARRGSRSLPTTPVHSPPGSPNSRRRKNGNRYFTPAFEPSDEAATRSWLAAALLGFKKELTGSTSTLAEEDAIEARLHGCTLAESVESLGPAPKGKVPTALSTDATQQPKNLKPVHAFRPKPSELREMNFWSPTSM